MSIYEARRTAVGVGIVIDGPYGGAAEVLRLLEAIQEDQLNGGPKALERLGLCAPLTICTRHLRGIGDVPAFVLLDDGGKLVRMRA